MTANEAVDRFGELLDSFFPAEGRGPSWAQSPYTEDVDGAVADLLRAGVSFEQLQAYVDLSWNIATPARLSSSDRSSLMQLLDAISHKLAGD
jgi:hypothetical protein